VPRVAAVPPSPFHADCGDDPPGAVRVNEREGMFEPVVLERNDVLGPVINDCRIDGPLLRIGLPLKDELPPNDGLWVNDGLRPVDRLRLNDEPPLSDGP